MNKYIYLIVRVDSNNLILIKIKMINCFGGRIYAVKRRIRDWGKNDQCGHQVDQDQGQKLRRHEL